MDFPHWKNDENCPSFVADFRASHVWHPMRVAKIIPGSPKPVKNHVVDWFMELSIVGLLLVTWKNPPIAWFGTTKLLGDYDTHSGETYESTGISWCGKTRAFWTPSRSDAEMVREPRFSRSHAGPPNGPEKSWSYDVANPKKGKNMKRCEHMWTVTTTELVVNDFSILFS